MKSPQLKRTSPFIPAASPGARITVMWMLLLGFMQITVTSFSPPELPKRSGLAFNTKALIAPAEEWVLQSTVRNVDFYYRISECSGEKVVFLKFNNRNRQQVKVSWREVFATQFDVAKEGFSGVKQLLLPTGETAQTDCSTIRVKECVVFANQVTPTYLADIRRFTFRNITVANQ